jgi:hypothetical protein
LDLEIGEVALPEFMNMGRGMLEFLSNNHNDEDGALYQTIAANCQLSAEV